MRGDQVGFSHAKKEPNESWRARLCVLRPPALQIVTLQKNNALQKFNVQVCKHAFWQEKCTLDPSKPDASANFKQALRVLEQTLMSLVPRQPHHLMAAVRQDKGLQEPSSALHHKWRHLKASLALNSAGHFSKPYLLLHNKKRTTEGRLLSPPAALALTPPLFASLSQSLSLRDSQAWQGKRYLRLSYANSTQAQLQNVL